MIDEFAKLRGRIPQGYDSAYHQTLREFGAEHANQFQDPARALECYHRLRSLVTQLEAAVQEDGAEPPPADDFDQRQGSEALA